MAASMHQARSPVPFCTELPVALGIEEAPLCGKMSSGEE